MALLDRRAYRMVAESGGPGWEFPLVVAQGVAGKPGLFLPGRTVYFCPFQPGVQQDDALRRCRLGVAHVLKSNPR